MTRKTVKNLRQWTEPNGTTHEPGDVSEIDIDAPGMDFEEHLLAQGVVEVVPDQPRIAVSRRGKADVTESEGDDATG